MKLIIISGRSGSGKSTALNALEDLGYNCIDNLPADLLPALTCGLLAHDIHAKVAVCIDARNAPSALQRIRAILAELPDAVSRDIIFLDASATVLFQRFSANRRKHPLASQQLSLMEAIQSETRLLAPIADLADWRIDTTHLSLQDLRNQITVRLADQVDTPLIALQFLSFGYKHGVPIDADLVFDVRCLPNPYWDANLRKYTGKDSPIIAFLSKDALVQAMFDDIFGFVQRWLPAYQANQRSYFTVAIGCTGGQHRSVFLAEQLACAMDPRQARVQVRHRELGLEQQ